MVRSYLNQFLHTVFVALIMSSAWSFKCQTEDGCKEVLSQFIMPLIQVNLAKSICNIGKMCSKWNRHMWLGGLEWVFKNLIGASLSEPHHVRSTVKSVFLLACLKPYRIWLITCSSANKHYIKYM